MKKLIFIILFLFINIVQADNHDTATSEEEIREARTLVTATEKVSISSEIAARVEKINFLMGDAFKKGDTLISFDCKLYNAQLEVIKADHKISILFSLNSIMRMNATDIIPIPRDRNDAKMPS